MRTRSSKSEIANEQSPILNRNFKFQAIEKEKTDFLGKKRNNKKENSGKKVNKENTPKNVKNDKVAKKILNFENEDKNSKNKKETGLKLNKTMSPPQLSEISVQSFQNSVNSIGEFFNDSFVDSLMYWRHENPAGSGLNNLGNTCFLNSVLQCILYTPPLKNYFEFTDHSLTCKIRGVCFICEYGKLSKMVEEKKRAITPQNIIQNIKNIAHHIKIGRQEDAHEFLLYFLSAMEGSVSSYLHSIRQKFTKIKKKNVPQFNEDNLIQKIFGGTLVSSVTCKKCKTASSKQDKFIDISLELDKNSESILDCMNHFCKPEDLTENNKYFCEKCKKKNDSIKKLSFQNFPRIFIFHLKRFNNMQRKIRKFVNYPPEINLGKYQIKNSKEKVNYRLCSVLVHEGNSIYSGHYYCYVRVNDNHWYCFNDDTVKKVDESAVLKQNPYLVFYEKVIDRNRIGYLKRNLSTDKLTFTKDKEKKIKRGEVNNGEKEIKEVKQVKESKNKIKLKEVQKIAKQTKKTPQKNSNVRAKKKSDGKNNNIKSPEKRNENKTKSKSNVSKIKTKLNENLNNTKSLRSNANQSKNSNKSTNFNDSTIVAPAMRTRSSNFKK